MAFNLIEPAHREPATSDVCTSGLEFIPSAPLIPEPNLEIVCLARYLAAFYVC